MQLSPQNWFFKFSLYYQLKNAWLEPAHTDIAGIVKIGELDNILKNEFVTGKQKITSITGEKKVLQQKK